MNSANSPVRLVELDALRGIASFLVVLYHYTSRYDRIYGYENGSPMEIYAGKFGVELFFMISGFVIFMSLGRIPTGWRGCLRFAVARVCRLYPVFWAAMTITFIATLIFGLPGREVAVKDLPANVTMLPGVLQTQMVDGVYWTLEKELFFYFWMALFLLYDILRCIRIILLFWLGLAIISRYLAAFIGFDEIFLYKAFKTVLILDWIPYFTIGILAYLGFSSGSCFRLDFTLLLMALAQAMHESCLKDSFLLILLVFIFYSLSRGWLCWLTWRPLIFLGTISYPLYLIHQNIGYIIIREIIPLVKNIWLTWSVAIFVSLFLAIGLAFFVEQPSLRLFKKISKSLELRDQR